MPNNDPTQREALSREEQSDILSKIRKAISERWFDFSHYQWLMKEYDRREQEHQAQRKQNADLFYFFAQRGLGDGDQSFYVENVREYVTKLEQKEQAHALCAEEIRKERVKHLGLVEAVESVIDDWERGGLEAVTRAHRVQLYEAYQPFNDCAPPLLPIQQHEPLRTHIRCMVRSTLAA